MDIRVLKYFLMTAAEKAMNELVQTEENLAGTISVGCSEMHSMKEFAQIMDEFQKKNPQVKFELYSSDNQDIKERIEQGQLDLGLLLEPVNILNYNFVRMNTKEQWGIFIHEESKLACKKAIHPGDLVGTKVVTVHINTPIHNELVIWSGNYAKDMAFSTTYNVLYNAVIVAREKKSAVVGMKLDCHYDNMKFIPFEPKLELSSVLAWKEHQTKSKTTTAFINFIKEKYKK
ncbi:MAG TPA: LysR family transcriptional regulator [Clostridium sp.]|nr:LysR family transcriptional regulator [Clostridium sp.]